MSAHSGIENLSQEGTTLRLLQSEKRVLSQVAAGVPLSKALEQLEHFAFSRTRSLS